MLATFYPMDVLGFIYDAQVLFSLFGRRLLELGLYVCLDWISWVHEEGITSGWLVQALLQMSFHRSLALTVWRT